MKLIITVIWLTLSMIFSCPLLTKLQNGAVENSQADSKNVLLDTFNSEECLNPCWLGIEVGVSDRQFVEDTLEQKGITHAQNGEATYNLFLDKNSSPLWVNMANPLGDIHLSDETVFLMTFGLNLCPASIVNAYDDPDVVDRESFLELLYPSYGMNFWLDLESGRIRSVALYTLDYIDENFPVSDRQSWKAFSDILSDECEDSLSSP